MDIQWTQLKYGYNPTLRGLYRGFTYPAWSNGLITGVAFHAYTYGKENGGLFYGGILSGLTSAFLSSYFDYKKIITQLNRTSNKFPIECFLTLTMREIPACLSYYPVYDIVKTPINNVIKKDNISIALAGGIAGTTCWLSSYWADVLNTNVMTGKKLKDVVNTLKINDYFRGMSAALVRGFIVNSVGYICYETSKTILS